MTDFDDRRRADLDAVRAAIAAGDIAGAELALRAVAHNTPLNSPLAAEIAELFHQLGFQEMAGRYWYLTEPKTEAMAAACWAFEHSLGNNPESIWLTLLNGRADSPRLKELARSANEFNRTVRYAPVLERGWRDFVALWGCGIVCFVLLSIFIAGLTFIASWFR